MKRSQRAKKMSQYSLAAGSLVIVGSAAQGAIIYTDLNPDVVLSPSGSYVLSMAGSDRVRFLQSTSAFTGINVYLGGSLFPGASVASTGKFVSALNANSSVKEKTSWVGNGANIFCATLYNGSFYGPLANTTNKYIGIRFVNGANTNYGWIQMNVPNSVASATITGYAYNDVADGPIQAGQIPEPAGLAALACGAAGIAALRRTRAA